MDVRRNLIVDAVALALYAAASLPSLTGVALHEWLGLGALLVLFAHCVLNAGWVIDAVRHPTRRRATNLALAVALLVALAATAVSGLMVSGAVLPLLGYFAPGYYFWDPLHAAAAKVLLALLIVHLVMHGRWIRNALTKTKESEDDDD